MSEEQATKSLSLADILDSTDDAAKDAYLEHHVPVPDDKPEGWDEEDGTTAKEGFCVECEDQPAQVNCEQCADNYCEVCFAAQHRKGTRKQHMQKLLMVKQRRAKRAKVLENGTTGKDDKMDEDGGSDWEHVIDEPAPNASSADVSGQQPAPGSAVGDWFLERAKYIPLRLTLPERKYLRLLEAALQVSEYTDKIDILHFGSKVKRIVAQIKEICAILSGLVLAADYKQGQELFSDRDFEANADFYQQIFELGRRHKIMNPDKMRTTYGKLIYILQDSAIPEVQELLNFSCIKPIVTVYNVLEQNNALELLRDNLIAVATGEIYSEGRSRREVQKDIRKKEQAVEVLSKKYASKDLDQEAVRQCIYSISDNHAFLRVNRDPCGKMIGYLKRYFDAHHPKDNKASLAIRSGKGGARLTHDHARQYSYVLQSLTLWKEILHEFFHLWYLAEADLLSSDITYRLRDTGQGLNRVQAAPKTLRMMHAILHRAQTNIGSWVGSAAIHMGDHNVPNALMFIDKYSQIYRILLPITNVLKEIPNLMDKPALRSYIDDEFGSEDNLYREILGDFFRHAFDGSGADNFFDAGSCIDGRLTSAWQWTSQLEKKRYFPVFLLAGFVGFDGEW
ncbi:uncharacterized protein FOMMEDRAFT_111459 [Fomitiporia mediterranea MF3/22]|uniref:uncharacterized protein n=1 Tax=Fomitiporia mediterranea (strain MF3/22) TaxID=694068 RepID=UPI00044078CC|nr:uncharacterized protein FOMMEDRAFT_111459 [Fomitiporia mediterranea MF3/22]EJD01551.1 hypothetical protein FOMMEDRAFT_111459 [Fomitiporia mediterranea MF3/22]